MKSKVTTTEWSIKNLMISFLKAGMVSFLLLLTGYACSAQVQSVASDYHDERHPLSQAKNENKEINHVANVNLIGKAVALCSTINSPYEDIKPALTPCGKRLYFSRSFHPDNTFGEKDSEDIWYAEFDSATNTWSNPALLASHLNNNGPNFINNVSVTGDTIILVTNI